MFDLTTFDFSLKIAWINKLRENPEWLEFAIHAKIDRLIWTGEIYHKQLINNVKNPFWSSVITAYSYWFATAKTKLITSPSFIPIWGNPEIKIPFNNDLFKSNFLFLEDLYDNQGMPLSKDHMETRNGRPIMLTTYFAIWKGIPATLKNQLRNLPKETIMREPPIVNYMKKCKKGTSTIRLIWDINLTDPPIGQIKWAEELNLNNEEDWEFIYSLAKQCKLDANVMFFHFQITHQTIMTNKKMFQFNLRNDDLCEECHVREDISHLLYNCPTAFTIWEDLKNWLTASTNQNYHFDQKSTLLGN